MTAGLCGLYSRHAQIMIRPKARSGYFAADTAAGKEVQLRMKIAIPIPSETEYVNYFSAMTALGAEMEIAGEDADPSSYDGLLLPGGVDIDPARYGQGMNGSLHPDPSLDQLQLRVLERFDRAEKPILGICRGHQLINVYFGGSLIQHLETSGSHTKDTVLNRDRAHMTSALPGSWLAGLYGERFATNSSHHQGVDLPGRGLLIDQRSEDGVVEGMHHENGRVFSVQWHPERMCFQHRRPDTADGSLILSWFLNFCRGSR